MRIILNGSVNIVKRLRVSLGTLVAIEATADSAPNAETAIAAAFEAITEIDRRMHPRAQGSDLARINRSPLHVALEVDPSIGQLLNLARRINTLSEGAFDPCLPDQPGRLSDIDVSNDETEVVCHSPVELDFGGFAKGYAVDCAVEALMAAGCSAGLVNAGGDVRVFGIRAEPMLVRGPDGELTHIVLADAALAVSDVTSSRRPPEHRGYYVRRRDAATSIALSDHELAPCEPAASPHQTTYAAVIASTAVVADALAKCVLLCPPAVAARALREFGATQRPSTRATDAGPASAI